MNEQVYEQLTLFPEDFHASRSAVPGSAGARMMTVISGRRCSELFRNSGPLGLLAKMLLESSEWRSTRCFLIWKARATKQGRLYFRLVPSTPRTGGTGAPLWLGTMTASQTGGNHSLRSPERRKGRAPSPAEFVIMWPTPTTGAGLCGGTGNYQQLKALEASGQITEEERRSMAAGNGGQLNPTWVEWFMGFPLGWTDLSASETP